MTEVLHVHPEVPEPALIARAAAVLRRGGLVAFPTETVYGLGANAWDSAACRRIFTAKGRPPTNPIIVHGEDSTAVRRVAAAWPATAEQLAARFWPGPLTLVLPRGPDVPDVVTANGPTVALRVPAHPVALALIRAAGVPVAAPSANPSGELSPTRAEHVLRGLEGRIDMVLDAGPTAGGLESTVLDLSRSPAVLLRPGLVIPAAIEAVIGPIARLGPKAVGAEQPLPSPGMLARHYAPRTPLIGVTGDATALVAQWCSEGQRIGWVQFDNSNGTPIIGATIVVLPDEPAAYAARLYAVLHELDGSGLDRIVVALPPPTEEWLTVHDRLRRACAET